MGISAIYPKRNLSLSNKEHKKYFEELQDHLRFIQSKALQNKNEKREIRNTEASKNTTYHKFQVGDLVYTK